MVEYRDLANEQGHPLHNITHQPLDTMIPRTPCLRSEPHHILVLRQADILGLSSRSEAVALEDSMSLRVQATPLLYPIVSLSIPMTLQMGNTSLLMGRLD